MIFEVWRPVVGYEGLYSVSDLGQVRRDVDWNRDNKAGKIIRIHTDGTGGYHRVCLCRNGKSKKYSIHSLVMAAFVGQRPEGLSINHKDGIKSDNRLSNLEYCTSSQNTIHSYQNGLQHGRKGEKHHGAKLTDQDVMAIREEYANGLSFESLSYKYSVCKDNIKMIVRNRTWKHLLVSKDPNADA